MACVYFVKNTCIVSKLSLKVILLIINNYIYIYINVNNFYSRGQVFSCRKQRCTSLLVATYVICVAHKLTIHAKAADDNILLTLCMHCMPIELTLWPEERILASTVTV